MLRLTRRSILSSSALLAASPVAPLTYAQAELLGDSKCNEIDDLINGFISDTVPGLSVSISKGGVPFYVGGHGKADVEHGTPVRPETVFQTASVGKIFVVVLAFQLRREGLLDINAPITNYLTEAPPEFERVSVRHLMTHTAGLNLYETVVNLQMDYSEDELVAEIFERGFEFSPGEKWSYSNAGFVLLGALLSRVGGVHYGDQLAERVFKPANMPSTRIISERDIIPNRAAGYEVEDGAIKNQSWVSPTFLSTADGACYTTAQDMQNWGLALRNRTIVSPEDYAQLSQPTSQSIAVGFPYGMGMMVATSGENTIHLHGGSWQGFRAYYLNVVEADVIVTVNANSIVAPADAVVWQVAKLMVPDLVLPSGPLRPPA